MTPPRALTPLVSVATRFAATLLLVLTACTGAGDSTAPALRASTDVNAARAQDVTLSATAVAAGWNHTCAILKDRRTYCWGTNANGQLGDGTTTQHDYASPVATKQQFRSIVSGQMHSCGLTSKGDVYCWGDGIWNELGDGTSTNRLAPVPAATTERFESIAAGGVATCALTRAGALYCWGWLVGNVRPAVPTLVSGNVSFRSISVGQIKACGIGTDGKTYCLAETTEPDPTLRRWEAQLVPSPDFVETVSEQISQCGRTAAGAAYCWGLNPNGQLGTGGGDLTLPTVPVSGNHVFTKLYAGINHYCGVTATNETWCWGANFDLSFPIGPSQPAPEPVLITSAGSLVFTTRSQGFSHSCGIATTSLVYCWRVDVDDHLGDGPNSDINNPVSYVPVLVRKGP
jgi:alpha-tubulin suppressor-like RCC1 family protein